MDIVKRGTVTNGVFKIKNVVLSNGSLSEADMMHPFWQRVMWELLWVV